MVDEKIAREIKEITSMYMCGPKVREYALTKGVNKWNMLDIESLKCGPKLREHVLKFINIQTINCYFSFFMCFHSFLCSFY